MDSNFKPDAKPFLGFAAVLYVLIRIHGVEIDTLCTPLEKAVDLLIPHLDDCPEIDENCDIVKISKHLLEGAENFFSEQIRLPIVAFLYQCPTAETSGSIAKGISKDAQLLVQETKFVDELC